MKSTTNREGTKMREINAQDITAQVKRLCMEANSYLPEDIKEKITASEQAEPWALAKNILGIIRENYLIAEDAYVPVCQDTGVACVFIEMGQDVHVNGNLEEAIHEGVRQGYTEGCLRKSVVRDPLDRVNTTDNTPAMIYYDIVPGDGFKLTVAPKGFGSENMSQIKMLKPSDGLEGVKAFILKAVEDAGPNPCPPIVVGVGIGGTFDKAALLAKKALMRNTNVRNADPFYAQLEEEMLEKINALGIGPQGVGGMTTALAVNIEKMATHIAGLPVAVNINCHVTRHKSVEL
jgi:fumarate hydratase subunit alpha